MTDTDKKPARVRSDAEPDAPPEMPPAPEEVVIDDARRKYRYVATYHGPSDILEITQVPFTLQLMRDVPTDISPGHVEVVEAQKHTTVEHILLDDEDASDEEEGK